MSRNSNILKWLLPMIVVAVALFGVHAILGRHELSLVSAAESGDVEKVQRLIQNGASINQSDDHRFGWTPLIAAIFANQTNMIHYLVDSGADVNLPSSDGSTPMMWEVAYGDRGIDIIRYLIDHGAKLDVRDKNGNTVLDRARSMPPKPNLVEVLEASTRVHSTNH